MCSQGNSNLLHIKRMTRKTQAAKKTWLADGVLRFKAA
jgi:hypothetical protein